MATKKAAKSTTAEKETKPAFEYKSVRKITLPLLKKEDGVAIFVAIMGPIFKGKEVKGTGDAAKMAPADLANILNLETGEEMQMICNAVLKSTLEEEYPGEGYVGKQFRILQSKVEGKRYKNYTVEEIEV